MRMPTTTRRREDGVVAVEFALVFPFLIMLMMGLFTGGLTFSGPPVCDERSPEKPADLAQRSDYSPSPTNWADARTDRAQQVYFVNTGSTLATSQICVQTGHQHGDRPGDAHQPRHDLRGRAGFPGLT